MLQLAKRLERRQEAQDSLAKAQEAGDAQEVEKFTRRTVRVRLGLALLSAALNLHD